ncbi:MAG TPA: DUF1684 domain-containing protein [Chryseolinea sp.]
MKRFASVVLVFFVCAPLFGQIDSAVYDIEQYRKKQENEFRDPEKSPLDKKSRKKFKGLNYFPINLQYRVPATFVKAENPTLFKMKTTTSRLPEYQKYGEVHFKLDGEVRVLEVYQSPEISQKPGLEDYLFIPFTDETNGVDTYEVGRYIEFRIPASHDVIIDFNKCYNPYCSYGSGFSCPIPPEVNHLPLKILAGEKKYNAGAKH